MKNTWQLQEAKNQLSVVVDNALTNGPQTITRHGEPAVVVISVGEFKKARVRKKSILELFEPIRGLNLDLKRDKLAGWLAIDLFLDNRINSVITDGLFPEGPVKLFQENSLNGVDANALSVVAWHRNPGSDSQSISSHRQSEDAPGQSHAVLRCRSSNLGNSNGLDGIFRT